MAAAGQPRAGFPGDDLRRTARKSEEADRTRQLLALMVILGGDPRRRSSAVGLGGGSRREAARFHYRPDFHMTCECVESPEGFEILRTGRERPRGFSSPECGTPCNIDRSFHTMAS